MSYNNQPYAPGYQPGQIPGGHQTSYPGAHPAGYPGQAPGIRPVAYSGQYAGGPPPQQPQYGGGPPPQQPQHGGGPPLQRPPTAGGFQGQPGNARPSVNPNVASWFRAVDQDNSGQVNAAELRLALQNGNWSQFSEEVCSLMIAMFDKDHTGTMDLYEFDQLFTFVNQWTDTYRRYDQDKSGSISESEMNSALQQMGYRLSPQFVNFLVTKYSKGGRGVGLDSFILINIKIRNLTDAFRSQDREMKGVITVNYEEFLRMIMSSV